MLLQFLEFSVDMASITALVLPIIAVCFFIITIPWLRNGSGSRLRRYLSYAITPPQMTKEESVTDNQLSGISRDNKIKLYFYYLGIALFLVSFFISEFYEVILDASIPMRQGSTDQYRVVTTIVFQSFFNAGWVGSLPWVGISAYHETWDWILFTAGLTDNPNFLAELVSAQLVVSIIAGVIFLSPLAIKSIRHSFVPAMFFFITGMTIFTKAAVGYFAGALKLLFTSLEFEYFSGGVNWEVVPNYTGVLTSGALLVLPMFLLYLFLSRRLWKVFYTDSRSKTWFTVYIALSFWIGFIITMVV